jgi:hypothetical protein
MMIRDESATDGTAVKHLAGKQPSGVIVFTPPQTFPEGIYTASFALKSSDNSIPSPVCSIEITDSNFGNLNKKEISGTEFPDTISFHLFSFEFEIISQHSPVQFIVNGYDLADIYIDQITFLPVIPEYLLPELQLQ